MILDLEQIADLINSPATDLTAAVEEHKKLNMLVNGAGVDDYIDNFEGFEGKAQKKLKKKVAKSTKHLFSALLRPFDKVFTAQGGSMFIDLPDGQKAAFKDRLSSIRYGQSFSDWIRTNWKNKLITDPNGLIFYEVKDGEAYPTYKAITSIHDYKLSGNHPEYVIFKHDDDYRVVDDAMDMIVRVDGQSVEILDEVPNYWEYVPAHTCSDLIHPTADRKLSPIDGVVDVAMEYMRDMNIHSVYKFLHGFPTFWKYAEDCRACGGSGRYDGDICSVCGGSGKHLTRDVSEVLAIEMPREGEPDITPPAGYVQPDLATWQQQIDELDWLYAAMHFALWGTHTRDEGKAETATGRFIDTQPVNDRLNEFADIAESIMTSGVNILGTFYFPNWRPAKVSGGRRFQIEPPDVLINKYKEARKEGMPEQTLTYMLMQYYQAMFANQPMQLAKMQKLMQVEPFLHLTSEQVSAMEVPRRDYLSKLYFTEWAEGLQDQEIIFTDHERLKEQLINYIKNKENERSIDTGIPSMERPER